MVKRLSDSNIWNKDWFLDLSLKKKLLVKYLFDNCDCAGIYEISYRHLRNCFGEEITKEDFKGIKQIKFISENKIFIEDFIKFQYNISIPLLNPSNNVHKGIIASLKKNNLLRVGQGLSNPYPRVLDKDKDKVKDKEKDKVKDKEELQKLYGEYQNVCLTEKQHGKLLAMCASEKLLNELIDSFSVNIEVGKERPYTAALPNAHYERIKSYYNWRRKNPDVKPKPAFKTKDELFIEAQERQRKAVKEAFEKLEERQNE